MIEPKRKNNEEQTPKTNHESEINDRHIDDEDSWEDDQREHSYYYDDAHGYEIYDPDSEDVDED